MRNITFVLIFAQFTFCCNKSNAQNLSVYNSYYINPYLYNPAEAATEFTYVFVNTRQQWMGVDGAPKTITANFNTMLNETRAGIGVKASSIQRGLLNTNDFTLTYVYGISIRKESNVFFGLSGGAIINSIDLAEATPDDPALSNFLNNNLQPTGSFGALFRSSSGVNLGVALPQLFISKFNSTESFTNTSPQPFDNIMISAYYRRKVEGKIVSRYQKGVRKKVKTDDTYAPLEFYLFYKYAKAGNSQAEAMLKLNLSQNFWLGAAYRQSYGFTGSLGFSVKNFLFSYSYEPGNQPEPAFSKGTHELQLGLRLGELKKFKRTAPVLRSTLRTKQAEQHAARFQQSVEAEDNTQQQEQTKKKFYVIIRAFSDFTGADAYKKKLIEQKYNANIFYYKKDKKYYVHVLETDKQSEANEEARNLKAYTKLKDAKVLVVSAVDR